MTPRERIAAACARARVEALEARAVADRVLPACTLPDGEPCPPKNETLGCARCPHHRRTTT